MNRNILAIGAHPDDLELGCGGSILQHVAEGDNVTMLVMTKGEVGPGKTTQRLAEQEAACKILGVEQLIWGNLPDCEVSLHELKTVHIIESAINLTRADMIYTHSMNDSHQDHRAVALATMGAARKVSSILSYEAPSAIHFEARVYHDITDVVDKKVEALLCHASQVAASEMVDSSKVRNSAGWHGHTARVHCAEAFEPVRYLAPIRHF